MSEWTFFSNYGHVLVCLERDNEARLRDVATNVGITERAVQKIVRDLVDAGYLEVTKHGRCNRYRINKRRVLRHPLQSQCTVGQLLKAVAKPGRVQKQASESTASAPHAEPFVEQAPEPPTEPPTEPRTGPPTEPSRQASAPVTAADPSAPVASRKQSGVPQKPADKPAAEAKKSAAKKKKSAKEDAPVDTRQQGSLF